MLAAVRHEACAKDCAVAGELTFPRGLLEQHLEAVPPLQVSLEVDLPAEDLRERHGELNLLAGLVDGGNDGWVVGVDAAADANYGRVLLVGQHLGVEHRWPVPVAADDAEEAVVVDLVFELAEEAVEREDDAVWPVRAEIARIEDGARRFHRGVDERGRQLVLTEQSIKCGITRYHRFNGFSVEREPNVRAELLARLFRARAAANEPGHTHGQYEPSGHQGEQINTSLGQNNTRASTSSARDDYRAAMIQTPQLPVRRLW